jgi:hypothetical protein
MNTKTILAFTAVCSMLFGCATFRDACKSEVSLIREYGRDIDRCSNDLRTYSNKLGRDWIEIGDRVYINN